jgi:broad specificity phosphatase PhoE
MLQKTPELVFLSFIRHGERCDNVDDPEQLARIEFPWDPPLTFEGEAQARMTGDHIKKLLRDYNYEYVVIEASPWIRTLQTAAVIAKQVGIPQVRVNFKYAEWMKGKFFPHGNPIGKLHIEQTPLEELKSKYLYGIDLDLSEVADSRKLVENTFPETYGFTASRINDVITELKQQYKYSDERMAHFVITHGANVSTFNQRFAREACTYIKDQVDYCGLSAVTMKGRSVRLVRGG